MSSKTSTKISSNRYAIAALVGTGAAVLSGGVAYMLYRRSCENDRKKQE